MRDIAEPSESAAAVPPRVLSSLRSLPAHSLALILLEPQFCDDRSSAAACARAASSETVVATVVSADAAALREWGAWAVGRLELELDGAIAPAMQLALAADGHVLAHRRGPARPAEVQQLVREAQQRLAQRLFLAFVLAKALLRASAAVRPPEDARMYTASSWILSKSLRERGIAAAPPPTEENLLVGVQLVNGQRIVKRVSPRTTVSQIRRLVDESTAQSESAHPYRLVRAAPRLVLEDGARTLGSFDFERSVLLSVEPLGGENAQEVSAGTGMVGVMIAWIVALFHAMVGVFRGERRREGAQGNERRHGRIRTMQDGEDRGEETKERNEYFGGDSTAFLGD